MEPIETAVRTGDGRSVSGSSEPPPAPHEPQEEKTVAWRSRGSYYLNRPLYTTGTIVEVTVRLNPGWYIATVDGRRRLLGPPGSSSLSLDQALRANVAVLVD